MLIVELHIDNVLIFFFFKSYQVDMKFINKESNNGRGLKDCQQFCSLDLCILKVVCTEPTFSSYWLNKFGDKILN